MALALAVGTAEVFGVLYPTIVMAMDIIEAITMATDTAICMDAMMGTDRYMGTDLMEATDPAMAISLGKVIDLQMVQGLLKAEDLNNQEIAVISTMIRV